MPRFALFSRQAGARVREVLASSRLTHWLHESAFALLLLTVALPLWRLRPADGASVFIPLHYNVYVGIDEFGPWYRVFLLPALGAAVFALNLAAQAILLKTDPLLGKVCALMSTLTQLGLFVSMLLITLLNL